MDDTQNPIPGTLRWAALLAFAYAAIVLVNATVLQQLNGWSEIRDYPRGVVRAIGYSVVGYGLLRGAKWAWWLGVVVSSFLVVAGALATVTLLALRDPNTAPQLPPGFLFVAPISMGLLVLQVVLLLMPQSRTAVRSGRPVQYQN